MITNTFPFIKNEPLVSVATAQKNLSKQFERGLVRISKNGKSLGYVISDEAMEEILEGIEASNPRFISEMKAEDDDKNLTSLEALEKEYNVT